MDIYVDIAHAHWFCARVFYKKKNYSCRLFFQVTIFVGKEGSYAAGKPNTKIFQVSQEFIEETTEEQKTMFTSDLISKTPIFIGYKFLTDKQKPYCDFFLSDETVLNELKTADVIVGDALYPCSTLAAVMSDTLHVVVNLMCHIGIPQTYLFGLTNYPSYVPQVGSLVPSRMALLARLQNVKAFILNIFASEAWIYPTYNELKIKHNIKPKKSIRQIMAKVDLILMEKDFTLQYAQQIPPCEY